MSFIDPNTIKVIGESINIPHVHDDAATALAPDVEYRLREVIQVRHGLSIHQNTANHADDHPPASLATAHLPPLPMAAFIPASPHAAYRLNASAICALHARVTER